MEEKGTGGRRGGIVGGPEKFPKTLENFPKCDRRFWFLCKIFFIFIYTKRVYILKACVGWKLYQNLIGKRWEKNCPCWKNFEKLINGRTSIKHQRVFEWNFSIDIQRWLGGFWLDLVGFSHRNDLAFLNIKLYLSYSAHEDHLFVAFSFLSQFLWIIYKMFFK